MEIKLVTDSAFKKYGRVITEIDFTDLVEGLMKTPLPDEVIYKASEPELEKLPVYEEITEKLFGELPIQIGYCNGQNHDLNALEYHRCSEINVAAMDAVLILGRQQDIEESTYNTENCEIFLLPRGSAVEIYATTLHYAPANQGSAGFRVAIILPKGTNTDLEKKHSGEGEDAHITAKNKWLYGHPQGGLPEGSPLGLVGENIHVE